MTEAEQRYVADLEIMYGAGSVRLAVAVHEDLWGEPAQVQATVLAAFIDRMRERHERWVDINAFWAVMDLPLPDIEQVA